MKKALIAVLAMMCLLFLAAPCFADGGGGPPQGMKTGYFTRVDAANHTVIFRASGTTETIVLKLAEGLSAESIPVEKKVMVTIEKINGVEVAKEFSRMFIGLTAQKIVALLIIGFIGGLLSGFIGSGGAFVLTPSMMSLGVPGAVAVASNMCHKFPKAMVGGYKRWKYGQADLKLGLVMAATAIIGVQIGIQVQKLILHQWGNAGSNLYVSLSFVFILVVVGAYVFWDAVRLTKGRAEVRTTRLALAMQKVKLAPVMHFKTAGLKLSVWVTIPVGLATGMLAATIAVGGFIGVPGMIYVLGTSAIVASATELIVAFIMGLWGSIQWGISGLIDIRLTLLILAGSLFGVQLGALGTTYVKDYVVKVVMGTVMLIVAVSRGAKVPAYLADLGFISVSVKTQQILDAISFWSLVAALATAGLIIGGAMIREMTRAKAEERMLARSSEAAQP
jgi:uncharacterized membrane protein YfcA